MTIEQKARAYDEALERAREWSETKNGYYTPKELCEEIFPELRKSEDEEIRKALINVFATHKDYEMFYGVSVEDIQAWLERQAKQKSIETTWKPSEEQMKVLDEVLNFAANHESPYWNDYIFETLNNLIRQLKKLKRE